MAGRDAGCAANNDLHFRGAIEQTVRQLAHTCNDYARSIITAERQFYADNRLISAEGETSALWDCYTELETTLNNLPDGAFLLNVGWGGGWEVKTIGDLLRTELGEDGFSQLRQWYWLGENPRTHQLNNPFSKTRHIAYDGGAPMWPMGWVRLVLHDTGGMQMEPVMICLVGEQPVPNLLPIRYCDPHQVVLVYSKRTERVSDNLKLLLKAQSPVPCEVHPYDIPVARQQFADCLSQHKWQGEDLLFNLTGGTKPMSLAAFRLAQQLQAPIVYLQSEGGQSLLYRYQFDAEELILQERTIIGELLTIDDYLRVHGLSNYRWQTQSEPFQQLVFEALQQHVSEIISRVSIGSLEIDLTIRCGNQVGVAEVKSGKAAERKDGIDQMSTASQREFLGTYTKRFLILERQLGTNNRELAQAHNIIIIELLDDWSNGLSEENRGRLVETVTKALGSKV